LPLSRSSVISATVAASVISLLVGGVIGYYVQSINPMGRTSELIPAAKSVPGGSAVGYAMSGPAYPGPAGFTGFTATPKLDLARTVRNLSMIEAVQGSGLTHDQATALAPILKKLNSSTLSDDDAKAEVAAIDKILTTEQHNALAILSPIRGGRAGFGGRGGGGISVGGAGSFGGGPSEGGDDNPFTQERNKAALEKLIVTASRM